MSIHSSHRGVFLAVLTATVATSSCGGGGGSGPSTAAPSAPPPASVRPVRQSNLEIAQSVYSGPRTPGDFFSDEIPTHLNVSTSHLKNSDVDVTAPTAPLFELCTNDWNQALDWSETRAENAPAYADLVETNDDPRYFEFGRVRSGDPDFYLRDRVFKCSYVDRSSANLNLGEGAAGSLNMRPLTAEELRTLSEYLWSFTSYNNFGYAVLESEGSSSVEGLAHTLYIAALEHNGLSIACDRIDVLSWRHTLNTTTGQLTLDVEPAFSFGARESGGVTEICTE